MSTLPLEISHLSKRYGRATVLDDVSLSIQPGEIFALLGPNGAGKTTLIGAVCGLIKKSAGTVRVFGTDLDVDPLTPRYEIGLVPQEINFDPFFTVTEALQIQLGLYGKPRDERVIAEVLAALALSDKAKSSTRALSGGMKRRLLIAKALVHRPRLVFLDEPTAGVDVELRRDLWAYVRRLRSAGTTLVLTTHYLEEAEELADRIGILNRGKLLLVEDKRALMRRLGQRRLEVRLTHPVRELPQAVLATGPQVSEDGSSLVFTEKAGGPSSAELVNLLYRHQLPVAELVTRHSRLEDVLLTVLHGDQGAEAAP